MGRGDKPQATPPATKPQNAGPMPHTLKPEAVTKKVMKAGSRVDISAKEFTSALAIVPNNARPAITITNAWGKAANKLTTEAPAKPIKI